MGIPGIDAPEEADSQCAWLVKMVTCRCLTEDMDILTFGANKIYRNLGSYKKQTMEINLDIILKNRFKLHQLIRILFALDYCDRLKILLRMICLTFI